MVLELRQSDNIVDTVETTISQNIDKGKANCSIFWKTEKCQYSFDRSVKNVTKFG